MNRVLVVGAVLVSLALGAWLILVAPALLTPDRPVAKTGNMIVASFGTQPGPVFAWVQSDSDIDPAKRGEIIVRFWASSQAPAGVSFVLSGPMLRNMTSCYGSGMHFDQTTVAYSKLTSDQRSAVKAFLQFSPAEGVVDSFHANQNVTDKDIKQIASSRSYVRVISTSSSADDRSYTYDSGRQSGFTHSQEFTFACSFKAAAFWADTGGSSTFSFPAVLSDSTSAGGVYNFLDRRVSFVTEDDYQLTSLGDAPDLSNSTESVFERWWDGWSYPNAVIETNQSVVLFRSVRAGNSHDLSLLWVGTAAAALSALLIALLRLGSDRLASKGLQGLRRLRRGATER